MTNRATRGLAVFASGYAKRLLESQYDRFTETELGQKLHDLDKKCRLGLEAGLHVLGAVIEQALPEDNSAVMFFKQILEDAPAELAKRLVNGARSEIQSAVSGAGTKEARMALTSLLDLDDDSLREVLRWFGNMDSTEKNRAAGVVSNLTADNLRRMAALSPDERKLLLDIQTPPPPTKSGPRESGLLSHLMGDVAKARKRLQENRDALRQKRRARSNG
jgi:hypothetical protein